MIGTTLNHYRILRSLGVGGKDTLEANVVLAAALGAAGRSDEAGSVVQEIYRTAGDFKLDAFAETQPYKERTALDALLADLRASGVS